MKGTKQSPIHSNGKHLWPCYDTLVAGICFLAHSAVGSVAFSGTSSGRSCIPSSCVVGGYIDSVASDM